MYMESKINKGGRPKKAIKRISVTGVRFTNQEFSIIKNKAQTAGLKHTVFIRQMAIHGHVIARITTEERQQIIALVGIANNINQMAKKAHQEGLVKSAISFEQLLLKIELILGRVKG